MRKRPSTSWKIQSPLQDKAGRRGCPCPPCPGRHEELTGSLGKCYRWGPSHRLVRWSKRRRKCCCWRNSKLARNFKSTEAAKPNVKGCKPKRTNPCGLWPVRGNTRSNFYRGCFPVYSWPVGTGDVPIFCKVSLIKKFKGMLPCSDVSAKFPGELVTFWPWGKCGFQPYKRCLNKVGWTALANGVVLRS